MDRKPDTSLLRYAGMATQLLVGLLLTVYAGKWLDERMQVHQPVFIWVLPLVLLTGMLVKMIKDTSKKR